MKPGRLYRALSEVPKPIFNATIGNLGVLTDDDIQSIVIHRGKPGNEGGINPSTIEILLKDNRVAKSGDDVTLNLSSSAAAFIGAKLSPDPAVPGYIKPRFSGRVGRQEMDDQGEKRYNTIYGASWTALLSFAPQKYSFTSGTPIDQLLTDIINPDFVAAKITRNLQGSYDHTYGSVEGTYSDLIGKFAGDVGLLMRERRGGGLDFLPLVYRRDRALAALGTSVPLTRSQAIAPARWEQPNESPPIEYRLTRRTNANTIETIVTSETGTPTGTAPVEDIDWTYFRDYSSQWQFIHAMRAATFDDRFRIHSVKVDMLLLLSSSNTYHHAQALEIIRMQVGDPVFLSGDWQTSLRGIHFAEGIREEITIDSWTIELDLVRFREVLGEASPTVPARTWESATYPWNDETRKWDEV